LVHGLDVTFGVGALFALVALAMVAMLIRLPVGSVAASDAGEAVELVDGEGFEWAEPELVA
jgi:hypothetical protein